MNHLPRVLSFCALILLCGQALAEGKIGVYNYENNDCTGRIDSTFFASENCFPHSDGQRSIRVFCDFNSIFTQFFDNANCEGKPSTVADEDYIPDCYAGVKTVCMTEEPKLDSKSVVMDFYNEEGCSDESARATFAVSSEHCSFTGSNDVYARATCEEGLATINYYSDAHCHNVIEGADTLQVDSSCTPVTSSPSGSFSRYGAHIKLRECREASGAAGMTFSVMLFAIIAAMAILLF
eukprot:CAMPEP_0117438522 /NCGR_PEP_ID=MMETSP0759-20121206/2096_1 /TAXON_ID=63605 /ORGANISM="Percolomonas cosmopolitus, Strain WS" /LENGTH=236 /DNA_ID=CAMNT_0005230215 /DNA_START=147 /DNA_END=857 /DNA_ORIENTATION=-